MTRTAAWSLPAVTVVAAAPALAASPDEAIDLAIQAQPFGDGITVWSPDRLQVAELTIPGGFDATNLGSAVVPAGSTVTLGLDSRLFTNPSVTADGVDLSPSGTQTSGNVVETSFLLPTEIPAQGVVSLRPSFTRVDPLPWATDIEPYTVTITPPASSTDVDPSNNTMTMTARYADTNDAEVSVTWREHELTTAAGDPLPISVQDTVTITANAPGEVPAGGSLTIGGPSAYDGEAYSDVFEAIRLVSATLDGQDVLSAFTLEPDAGIDDRRSWRISVPIPAGQSLVVDVDIDIATSTRESVYSGAWTQFYASRDRDDTNNRGDAGPTP